MLGFDRITFAPGVMGGRACIRGMRITVSLVLNLVANGMAIEEIVAAYPYLEPEDVRQSLRCLSDCGNGAAGNTFRRRYTGQFYWYFSKDPQMERGCRSFPCA